MMNELSINQVLVFLKKMPSDTLVKMSYHSEQSLIGMDSDRVEKYMDCLLSNFNYFTDGWIGFNYANETSVTVNELIDYIEHNNKNLADGILIDIEDGISYSPAKDVFLFKGFAVISTDR